MGAQPLYCELVRGPHVEHNSNWYT